MSARKARVTALSTGTAIWPLLRCRPFGSSVTMFFSGVLGDVMRTEKSPSSRVLSKGSAKHAAAETKTAKNATENNFMVWLGVDSHPPTDGLEDKAQAAEKKQGPHRGFWWENSYHDV
jgi:hypothetical protein